MPEVRPIDGNALIKKMCFRCKKGDEEGMCVEHCDFIAAFDSVPTLDAVPVVRCRECKHYRESAVYRHCALHKGLAMVTPDSFCSYGVRREDNGKKPDATPKCYGKPNTPNGRAEYGCDDCPAKGGCMAHENA